MQRRPNANELQTHATLTMLRYFIVAGILAEVLFQAIGSAQAPFSMRVVASGLKAPWEVMVGPDDQLWVTERTGRRVIRVNPATGAITPALDLTSESYDPGESWHEGLLGLALHPDLLKKAGRDYVYLAFTYDSDPGPGRIENCGCGATPTTQPARRWATPSIS